jgi:hypothetical protein
MSGTGWKLAGRDHKIVDAHGSVTPSGDSDWSSLDVQARHRVCGFTVACESGERRAGGQIPDAAVPSRLAVTATVRPSIAVQAIESTKAVCPDRTVRNVPVEIDGQPVAVTGGLDSAVSFGPPVTAIGRPLMCVHDTSWIRP